MLVPTQTSELFEAMEEDHPPVTLRPISNEREPLWDVEMSTSAPSIPPGPLILEYRILKKNARGLFHNVLPGDYETKILRFKSVYAKRIVPEKPLALPGNEVVALNVECGSFNEREFDNPRQKKSNLAVKLAIIHSRHLDKQLIKNINPSGSLLKVHGIHCTSGVSQTEISNFTPLASLLPDIRKLLRNRIIVGFGINNDLRALFISAPAMRVRDLSEFTCLREAARAELADSTPVPLGQTCKLKVLYAALTRRVIQENDSHDPVEDSMAPLALYYAFRAEIEREFEQRPVASGPYGMYPGNYPIDDDNEIDYEASLRERRKYELRHRHMTPAEEDEYFDDFI